MANLPMPAGMTNSDLECVMLRVDPGSNVRDIMGEDFNESELFYGEGDDLKYAQGIVLDNDAHVTLLFGIWPSEHYEQDVFNVLTGDAPNNLLVSHVGFFPSYTEGQEYFCVVAYIAPSRDLMSINRRLTALPHTNRFTEYKPHMTIAYLKPTANLSLWLDKMGEYFSGRVLLPAGIDTGVDS